MRPIPDIAVDFVAQHEGKRLTAYQDSVGVWTIGYGHTLNVRQGQRITDAQARNYLRQDLGVAEARLRDKIGNVVEDLTDHQFAAMLSFVFNLGTPGTTIWQRLRARQFDQVPVEMMRFVYAGGRKLQGLVNRRTDEVRLWSTAEPGSVDEDPPSSVTRAAPTPPASMEAHPVGQSASFWTGAATAATGAAAGVTQVQSLVAPQAANSHLLAQFAGILAVVVVGLGIAVMVFRWLDHRRQRA